jgi:hypothetical protein
LRGAEPSDVTRRSMSRASSSIEWPRSAARTRRRCLISSSRLRIVMLAMAVISVSVGAASVIDDFNDINAIGIPNWLPKLANGGVEKWCLTQFLQGHELDTQPVIRLQLNPAAINIRPH